MCLGFFRPLRVAVVLAFALQVSATPRCVDAAPRLKVVATTLPVYIFAKNVSGGTLDVSLLVPSGTDIHEYALKPSDLRILKDADIVLISGAGLDEHLGRHAGKKLVDTSQGASLIKQNPHLWLDPLLAAIQVRNIAEAFAKKDIPNAQRYKENAGLYIRKLEALHKEIDSALMALRECYLITHHEAFSYFCRRYGLRCFSLSGPAAEGVLPSKLKEAYDILKSKKANAVFAERQFPSQAVKKLALETGAMLCELDTIETGTQEADHYEAAMRKNLSEILRCLKEGS